MSDRPTRWRQGLRIVAVLAVAYCCYALVMLALQRWFIFPRHATRPDPEAARRIAGLRKLWIESPQGRVEGWLLPGDGVSATAPGPAVIFAHGNAELIEDWPDEMRSYRRWGVSVLLAEYRGYGRSAGDPSEEAITSDLVRFYDSIAGLPEVDRSRIVFHGRSLGGGAVCALAARRAPRALVLQSTFTSIRDLARRFLLPGVLVRDPFDNLSVIERFDGPVLIAHGERDELIPYRHAERLHRASPSVAKGRPAPIRRLLAYPHAGHNDCPPSWDDFWRQVRLFLVQARVIDPPSG